MAMRRGSSWKTVNVVIVRVYGSTSRCGSLFDILLWISPTLNCRLTWSLS